MKLNIHTLLSFMWPMIVGMILGVGVVLAYTQDALFVKTSFLSPLGMDPQILAQRLPTERPLMGFLPYWTIHDADIPYHLLDELAFFGIGLNIDGTANKTVGEGGWYQLNGSKVAEIFEQADKYEVNTILVVTAFDNEVIDTLIHNEASKKQAILTIGTLIKDFEFDGVNIDFEYNLAYPVEAGSGPAMVIFLQELRHHLDTIQPNLKISMDLYANAIIKDNPYTSLELSKVVDSLVLMGYDFHQMSSPKAGPVAPLKSSAGRSITEALEAAWDKGIDSQKIVLAMPLYGYEWQTTTQEYGSPTYPGSGALASYKRVHALIKDENIEAQWDHVAMSPWLVYEKDNRIQQIYYENDESISLKLQLIEQANLGGGAFWALGYEGKQADIWRVIELWRQQQNEKLHEIN